MSGELKDLFISTRNLFKRFDLEPDRDAQLLVFTEEANEFIEAVRDDDIPAATEEGVDVMVTICSTLIAMGIGDVFDILDIVRTVIEKNDAKTRITHFVNDEGKIQRIGRNNGRPNFSIYSNHPRLD